MARQDRYTLQIARLDGRALRHDPGPVSEVFEFEDDEELERVCGRHFIPLACAAEGSPVYDRLRDMPFLDDYTLEIYHPNRGNPIATSRSTCGRDTAGSRFH